MDPHYFFLTIYIYTYMYTVLKVMVYIYLTQTTWQCLQHILIFILKQILSVLTNIANKAYTSLANSPEIKICRPTE